MKRKFILVLCFLLAFSQFAFAESKEKEEEYGVRFVSISTIDAHFTIRDSGKAIVSSLVVAYPDQVDFLKMNLQLQQFNNGKWVTIKSWTNTNTYNYCNVDEQYYVMSGYQYRTVTKVYTYLEGRLIETDTTTTGSRYHE